MSVLLAGPWNAEFGWELMTWIPAIRHLSQKYDKTVIVCREGHEYLYQDFADDFEIHTRRGRGDRWLYEGKLQRMPKRLLKKYKGAKIITPTPSICMKAGRKFFQYGTPRRTGYDILIHARSETKYGQQRFNWPVQNYVKVLEKLGNPKAASIGTKAYHIPGTKDLRGIDMAALCDYMAASRILIGPSSGAMHLGALCNCPLLVWTGREKQKIIKTTNAGRYKKLWNPFGTPVTVLDQEGWRPSVHLVVKALKS